MNNLIMRFTGFVGRPNLSRVGTAVCLCLQTVASAGAQTTQWSDRVFLNVNVTRQLTARPFDEGLAPVIYAERGVLRTTHPGKGGEFMVEPAGGVRIWKNLGAGAAFVWWTAGEPSAVRAIVPHPILFNQPRGATTVASFERFSTVGLNAGVDVTLLLTPTIGIGFTTRYVRGYAATSLSDGTPVDLDVGGLQVGVGARLRLR